jgi:glycosyltransferase involved in cell wall biosynthesis
MSERVAVIIPCYNHARYVGEALESVLGQTHQPDRVLVIDDGSKDDSVKVLREFEKRGVEVSGRENRWAHNTINELIELAAKDCDFISILNSDDRYLPDRIEKCLEAAWKHPDKAVISTRLRVIDGGGAVMPEDAPRARWFHGAWSLGQQEGIDVAEWLGQANFIATTSNIFARAAYLRANPMRDYRFIHDYFFLSTAAFEQQIELVPEVLMEYRVHGSNTIATRPEPLIREMVRLQLDLYQRHAETLRTQPEFRRRFYDYVRGTWSSISSLHAGLVQVALAQLAAQTSGEDLERVMAGLQGPEFEEFPNKTLAGAHDGSTGLALGGVLSKRVEDLKEKLEAEKKEKESLEQLARFRQKLLRSKWVRLGLALGLARGLVSNKGKKPQEKLEALRGECQGHWWLKAGEKVGSQGSYELRRGMV